jgi:hypothetical protein
LTDNIRNIDDIVEILPKCINKVDKLINDKKNKQLLDEVLNNISLCITDTRNEIAHAKANYQTKGNECPSDQREQLANSLSIIARQMIRWFAAQPDFKRVI